MKFFVLRQIAATVISVAAISTTLAAPGQNPWVVYGGGEGPGKGKHIVFITGEESYRSEESMPLLARILSQYHGNNDHGAW